VGNIPAADFGRYGENSEVVASSRTSLIPTIAREQHVSLEAAQWMLTLTLPGCAPRSTG
jgi:hypothetical protein